MFLSFTSIFLDSQQNFRKVQYAKNWIFHKKLYFAYEWLFNHAVCKIGLKDRFDSYKWQNLEHGSRPAQRHILKTGDLARLAMGTHE